MKVSVRMTGLCAGLAVLAAAASGVAMADSGPLGLFNPLGVYIGGGIGRTTLDQLQFDPFDANFHRIDDHPLGWNAYFGARPIPFLGAELEYLDFGTARVGAGPVLSFAGGTNQFLGGETHDRALAAYAVGYLPLPLPYVQPFVKVGGAQIREHTEVTGNYNNVFANGAPLGYVSASETDTRSALAYGGGIQFHFDQIAVRAQYERISISRNGDLGYSPSLLSVGLTWTF